MDAFTAFFLVVGVGFFAGAAVEAKDWKNWRRWAFSMLSLVCGGIFVLCLWATYLDLEHQMAARSAQSTSQAEER